MRILPPPAKIIDWIRIKLKERKYCNKLNYLFYNNHSDKLIIIFSAFSGNKRRYNYVKGLRSLKIDKLYILDPFGYKGSYNMYENGSNYPELLTAGLIKDIIATHNYKKIYTAGSSKGGTCAIYFGLPIKATAIFAGACQFNLGTYLHRTDHEEIFQAMMGKTAGDKEAAILNRALPKVMEKAYSTKTVIHVLYSKKELTYERQVVDLLAKANECHIPVVDVEESFAHHEDVGAVFLSYLKNFFQLG